MNVKDFIGEGRKYMLVTMNEGGLPVITFGDDLQALKDSLSYIQHYLIKDVQTGKTIEANAK